MRDAAEIEKLFADLGADFLLPVAQLQQRLQSIKAFVFDWDGVFNDGVKGENAPSSFSEPDSMGTNMLRYAHWRARGELPVCAVISGAHNPTAKTFASREHFHAVYCGFADKTRAFEQMLAAQSIEWSQVAYVFDDINDLSAAKHCGLRFLVRRGSSPLLREFCAIYAYADYVTGAQSGLYPVREICELLLGLLGGFPVVFESRSRYDEDYQAYFAKRQSVQTLDVDAN